MGAPLTSNEIDVHVGRRLRELRRRAGLSLKVVADRLNFSHQQINKYEKGQNRISVSTLIRLADVLHVQAYEFYAGLPDVPPTEERTDASQRSGYDFDIVYIGNLSPTLQKRLGALVDSIARSSKFKRTSIDE